MRHSNISVTDATSARRVRRAAKFEVINDLGMTTAGATKCATAACQRIKRKIICMQILPGLKNDGKEEKEEGRS